MLCTILVCICSYGISCYYLLGESEQVFLYSYIPRCKCFFNTSPWMSEHFSYYIHKCFGIIHFIQFGFRCYARRLLGWRGEMSEWTEWLTLCCVCCSCSSLRAAVWASAWWASGRRREASWASTSRASSRQESLLSKYPLSVFHAVVSTFIVRILGIGWAFTVPGASFYLFIFFRAAVSTFTVKARGICSTFPVWIFEFFSCFLSVVSFLIFFFGVFFQVVSSISLYMLVGNRKKN